MRRIGKANDRLDSHAMNYEREKLKETEQMREEFEIDERRFQAFIGVMTDLSNSIKELASATANRRPPVVMNLIASNDEDLKKFATIFAQEIK